jgi:hypothetical protein
MHRQRQARSDGTGPGVQLRRRQGLQLVRRSSARMSNQRGPHGAGEEPVQHTRTSRGWRSRDRERSELVGDPTRCLRHHRSRGCAITASRRRSAGSRAVRYVKGEAVVDPTPRLSARRGMRREVRGLQGARARTIPSTSAAPPLSIKYPAMMSSWLPVVHTSSYTRMRRPCVRAGSGISSAARSSVAAARFAAALFPADLDVARVFRSARIASGSNGHSPSRSSVAAASMTRSV